MWESIGPWLAGGGGLGFAYLLARVFLKLHNDAIASESKRADAAERRAEAAEKRADLREEQMATLLGRVREPT